MSAITKRDWRRHRKAARESLKAAIILTQAIKKDAIDNAQQIRKSVGSHQQGSELANTLLEINTCISSCRKYLEVALTNAENIPIHPPETPKTTK
jgi:hypothetical protein